MGVAVNGRHISVSAIIPKRDHTTELKDPISQCHQWAARVAMYPWWTSLTHLGNFILNSNLTKSLATLHYPGTEHVIRNIHGRQRPTLVLSQAFAIETSCFVHCA